MPVNYEVKGMLARLLATEDIVVEHRRVETACFDVQKRVLTLPMWESASNNVYDLLLSHEAGHALYTPSEDWTFLHKFPQEFANVVEDARIEKLLKRRYAGLSKTFYLGYKELSDNDFFSIRDEKIEELNLADRINLYFKIGSHLKFTFTPEEQSIVDLISICETFSDTLEAAEILYNYCKKEFTESINSNAPVPPSIDGSFGGNLTEGSDLDQNNKQAGTDNVTETTRSNSIAPSDETHNNSNIASQQDSQKESDLQSEDSKKESNSQSENSSKVPASLSDDSSKVPASVKGNVEVMTVSALTEAIKKLTTDSIENDYIESPEINLDQIIIPHKEIHDKCKEYWGKLNSSVFNKVDKEYIEFKRSAQKEVNYLIKEFERKKSADEYSRTSTSRTGILDCSKLHTYKYNDDIFKKISIRPDGKNHGLIFILDWSGSMNSWLFDTVKQLYNLIWFCRKLSIPFEVYAFTTDYPKFKTGKYGVSQINQFQYQEKDGLVHVLGMFSLMNFLSSKVSTEVLETHMKNIFRIAYISDGKFSKYKIPSGLALSGTPLTESIIVLQSIIPKFQKENNVHKVNCVILTDGDACQIKYHKEYPDFRNPNKTFLGLSQIRNNTILRNRKTGRTYSLGENWWDVPNTFLRNLSDMFPDVNLIGIRLMSSREASNFVRRYVTDQQEYDNIMTEWRKEKSINIKTSGYDSYFGICSSSLVQESDFDQVPYEATKSQIKNAFLRSLKTKKMNKKILGDFVSLIA
jgi:hypothetical protein